MDLAESPISDQFASAPVRFHGPLLAAGLENTTVAMDGLHDHSTFANGQTHRLFNVQILARLAGVDADRSPPLFRCCGDDAVDVRPFQQPAIVLVGTVPSTRALTCTARSQFTSAAAMIRAPGVWLKNRNRSPPWRPTPMKPTLTRSFAPGRWGAARTPVGSRVGRATPPATTAAPRCRKLRRLMADLSAWALDRSWVLRVDMTNVLPQSRRFVDLFWRYAARRDVRRRGGDFPWSRLGCVGRRIFSTLHLRDGRLA
jgi:hypothetical protein